MRKIILAAIGVVAASGVAAAPPSPQDQAMLEKLALSSDQAWDAKDIDRFTAHYAPDGSIRIADGAAIIGEAAMRAYFGRAFAARPEGFRHISKVEAIDMIDADTAHADTHVRVERRQSDGSWVLLREFRSYSVVVRAKDGWRLRSVRAAPLAPRPAA